MEDLAVITGPNHSVSFRKNFVKFKRKNKNIIHHPRSVRIGKNCAVAEVFSPIRTSKLANNIYFLLKGTSRPIREITSCNGADADINRF